MGSSKLKVAPQPSNHPTIQQSNHPAIQQSNHPAIQQSSNPAIQPSPPEFAEEHPMIMGFRQKYLHLTFVAA
ncbi:MAG: hypothetical protein H6556_22525 [Lewinellaceae bacterium]|nr:hypothetical protein [Lewinellaceae bacterium]